MTKKEAIEEFVERNFSGLPLDWVQAVSEAKGAEIYAWPMWGTMWIVDEYTGTRFMEHSRRMVGEADEIDLDSIEDKKERKEVKTAIDDLKKESVAWGGVAILEQYVDEEMAGADCILDKNGATTAAYIYEIDGTYVMGVHGAGWNFYDGLWDMLYDLLGYEWHEAEQLPEQPASDGSIAV